MKILLHVLLTALVAGGAIAIYHVTVAEAPRTADQPLLALGDRDLAGLEARIAALEGRSPILLGSSSPADLVDRVRALEERVAALPRAPVAAALTTTSPSPDPGGDLRPAAGDEAGEEGVDLAALEGGPLTPAQRAQIRSAVSSELQAREDRRTLGQLQRRLDSLGIRLDETQQQKLTEALSAHREAVRETFRSARDEGLDRDQMRDQMAQLNQKLTESLSTFIAPADAEAITSSLGSVFQRGPRGGGDGGDGGRRNR